MRRGRGDLGNGGDVTSEAKEDEEEVGHQKQHEDREKDLDRLLHPPYVQEDQADDEDERRGELPALGDPPARELRAATQAATCIAIVTHSRRRGPPRGEARSAPRRRVATR